MRVKEILCSIAFLLMPVSLVAAPAAGKTESITISTITHVPGATLRPGTYSISVVNRLSDRVILRMTGANGSTVSTFLGADNAKVAEPAHAGPVLWANPVGGESYLKGWSFAETKPVVEFFYPKTDAVALATANAEKVPAVDPASEGKPADDTISQNDMELLNLWVLSLEQVGSAAPGIKAARFDAPTTVASVEHKPVIHALPHTASLMPWMWLASVCLLLAAAVVRMLGAVTTAVPHRE